MADNPNQGEVNQLVVVPLTHNEALKTPTPQQIADMAIQLGCFIQGHQQCPEGCRIALPNLQMAGFLEQSSPTAVQTNLFTSKLIFSLAHLTIRDSNLDWNLIRNTFKQFCDANHPKNTMQHLRATVDQVVIQLRVATDGGHDHDNDERISEAGDNEGAANGDDIINDDFDEYSDDDIEDLYNNDDGGGNNGGNGGDQNNNPPPPNPPPPNANNLPPEQAGFLAAVEAIGAAINGGQHQLMLTMQRSSADASEAAIQRSNQVSIENYFSMANTFYGKTGAGKENYPKFMLEFDKRAVNWDNATKIQRLQMSAKGEFQENLYQLERASRGRPEHRMFVDDWPALRKIVDEMYCESGTTVLINFRKSNVQYPGETFRQYYSRADLEFDKFFNVYKEYITRQLRTPKTFLGPQHMPTTPIHVPFSEEDHRVTRKRLATLGSMFRLPNLVQEVMAHPRALNYFCSMRVEDKQLGYDLNSAETYESVRALMRWKNICFDYIDGAHREDVRKELYKLRDKKWDTTELGAEVFTKTCHDLVLQFTKIEDTITKRESIYTKGNQGPKNNGQASEVKGSPSDGQVGISDFHAEPDPESGATVPLHMPDGTMLYASTAIINKIKAARGSGKAKKGRKRKQARQSAVQEDGNQERPPSHGDGGGYVDVIRGRGRGGLRRGGRPGAGRGTGRGAVRGAGQAGERYIGVDGKARTPGHVCNYCNNLGHTEADCEIKKREANFSSVGAEWGGNPLFGAREAGQIFANRSGD